jgi:hypothetical protein
MTLYRTMTLVAAWSAIILAPAPSARSEAEAPQSTDQVLHVDTASHASCFNFRTATDFKTVAPGMIRLSVRSGQAFDIGVSGPSCASLSTIKDVMLRSAPAFDICTGRTPDQWALRFENGAHEVIQCEITSVAPAAPKTPAQAPQK